MIHVSFSVREDVEASLDARVVDRGYSDLADYLRALVEADADAEGWEMTPEIAAAIEEGERSGFAPYDFEEIMAEARREFPGQ